MILAFPILPWLLAVAAAGGGYWVTRKIHRTFSESFKRKRLAILGERGVGKSTLFTYLSTKAVPKEYEQNTGTKKVEGEEEFEIGDINFKMKKSSDVSGDEQAMLEWKKSVERSDLVFYLFRADRFKKGISSTVKRVKKDISHIASWMKAKDNPKSRRLYLIGTHCDKDKEYRSTSKSSIGTYYDNYKSLDHFKSIKSVSNFGEGSVLLLGSMKDEKSIQKFVYTILERTLDHGTRQKNCRSSHYLTE